MNSTYLLACWEYSIAALELVKAHHWLACLQVMICDHKYGAFALVPPSCKQTIASGQEARQHTESFGRLNAAGTGRFEFAKALELECFCSVGTDSTDATFWASGPKQHCTGKH